MDLMKWNALYWIAQNVLQFADDKYKDFSLWEKFNQVFQVDLVKMATAHSYYMTAVYFHKGIDRLDISTDKSLVRHLKRALRIYCLDSLLKEGSALALNQHLTPEHFRIMYEVVYKEYRDMRPQMLNLVEAFEFDENILLSTIGSYDGNVYE
jgi:hypothetical protein